MMLNDQVTQPAVNQHIETMKPGEEKKMKKKFCRCIICVGSDEDLGLSWGRRSY